MSSPGDISSLAEFSVNLSGGRLGRCAADRCRDKPTLIATLAYCFCDEVPEEHGHPGSPDATRHDIEVCEMHGALIAHGWECFERLTNQANP